MSSGPRRDRPAGSGCCLSLLVPLAACPCPRLSIRLAWPASKNQFQHRRSRKKPFRSIRYTLECSRARCHRARWAFRGDSFTPLPH
uniref:Putative secreted protein n=1 Tax=Anopheles darlingi TaxID=43151 RepID=A0A2M4D7E3_ANODA